MRTIAIVQFYQDFQSKKRLNVIFQPAREGRLFLLKSLFTKTYTTMKEFINFMQTDIEKENFSTRDKVVYGILVPLALVILMAICDTLS